MTIWFSHDFHATDISGQVDNAYVMPPPNPQPVAGGGPPPPVNRHLKSWKLNDPVPALKGKTGVETRGDLGLENKLVYFL